MGIVSVLSALMNQIVKIILLLTLAAELCFGGSRGFNRRGRRKHGHRRGYHSRKYHHHKHDHIYEYFEPSYERVYERDYDPHHDEDIEYRDDIDIGGGGRVAFDTGSRFGGLDLAAALGLSGVGYVANSGGALHVVG